MIAGVLREASHEVVSYRDKCGNVVLWLCALYANIFTEYRGPSEFTGQGGTVKEVDDIEVWTSGEPNRRFKVLGVIDQSHFNNGSLLSLIASLNRDSELIATATEHGGDAIVFIGANSVITGYSTVSPAQNNLAYTHANKEESLRAAVIKYLD